MTGDSASGPPGPTPEDLEAFRQNYLAAFLGYLARRDETALRSGYELGRSAVADRLGLLEVAGVHHDVFLQVLSTVPPG